MALHQFQALVLKGYETGNSSEVIHLLTPHAGRLSLYVRGLNRRNSRTAPLMQPLSLLEVTAHGGEDAEMLTLREASLLADHAAITTDFERLALALLLADAASSSCAPGQPAPEVFETVLGGLALLHPASGLDAPGAACRALLNLLFVSGYELQIDPPLLAPWPADRPRPVCFWVNLESATIHARRAQPASAPRWPVETGRQGGADVPVPPSAVRLLFELQREGAPPRLPDAEAHQFIDALVRVIEVHQEVALPSADFWRRVRG